VRALIIDGMFYGMSGVLTSVATHHPELDFAAICSGYADWLEPEAIHALRESLLPHAQLVAEQVFAQWVMDACHVSVAEGAHSEDVIQPTDGMEPRTEANIIPPPTEPNIIPQESEQPLSSPVAPLADLVGRP